MSTKSTTHSYPGVLEELSTWLVGGGILTLALFPLALPAIALTAIAALPFLLVAAVGGLIAGLVAASIRLARAMWPLVMGALHLARAALIAMRHGFREGAARTGGPPSERRA